MNTGTMNMNHPFELRKNKPNQTQHCSTPEIRTRPTPAGPPANLRRRRNKINQTCFRFFKIPQNSPKTTRFSKFFSHFLTFSHFFASLHPPNPPFQPNNANPKPLFQPNPEFSFHPPRQNLPLPDPYWTNISPKTAANDHLAERGCSSLY